MASLSLLAVAAVHFVTAAAFVAVGVRFRLRAVAPGMTLPRDAFVAWWLCFAAYLAGTGALDAMAALGAAPLQTFVAFRLASGPLIAAAAWGLGFHIIYLWSGKAAWALPLAFYYGAAGTAYSFMLWGQAPSGVEVTAWSAAVTYDRAAGGPVWAIVLASIGLPLVAGNLAYLGLAFKADDRAQRYRIVLVASSLLVWVSSGYAAEVGGDESAQFLAIVVLGLLTAGTVTLAYFPPLAIRTWLAAPGHGRAG